MCIFWPYRIHYTLIKAIVGDEIKDHGGVQTINKARSSLMDSIYNFLLAHYTRCSTTTSIIVIKKVEYLLLLQEK